MQMKYFQAIADIRNHYDDLLKHFEEPRWGHLMLESWGIDLSEKELLIEEREALRYLIGCQLSFVREKNATKPSLDVVQRCFNRQLSYLERIHGCYASNVNKHKNKLIQKNYKACRHYLFKFSLPAWYAKLPEQILTLENKYSRVQSRVVL